MSFVMFHLIMQPGSIFSDVVLSLIGGYFLFLLFDVIDECIEDEY